jgi:hypothetical protein
VLGALFEINNETSQIISLKEDAHFTRQYFLHVRQGAVRIGATSDTWGFEPVVFVNSDGRHVVIVKAAQGGPIVVNGLPLGRYQISYAIGDYTSGPPSWAEAGPDRPVKTSIPEAGVLTISAE